MDHILLCTNHIPPITTIYNSFIEDYMPAANGSYVKVYLYIAKCLQAKESNFSISSLADQLENTEKDNIEEFMFMGLRMIKGIEEKEFEIRFKKKVDEVYKEVIEKHIKNSLLIRENGRIFLTKKGIELSNIVMSDMILE